MSISSVGQIEKKTQARVVKLFRDTLKYNYLGDCIDRDDNRNIETELLSAFLKKQEIKCLYAAYSRRIAEFQTRLDKYRRNTFPLSVHGYSARIVKLTGVNTENAVGVGKVTYVDLKESCLRDASYTMGEADLQRCISKVGSTKDQNETIRAIADCPRGTLLTSHLGEFKLLMSKDYLQWQNIRTGETLDGSAANGAPVVEDQFRMLCPAFLKGE